MLNRRLIVWLLGTVLAGLLLSACNTVEHRSEAIAKNPLPALCEPAIHPELWWKNTKSSGVGKSDAKLRLALSDREIVVADNKGKILALDRESGEVLWTVKTKAKITAGPALSEGRILVATDDGQVLAYQASDGKFLWCSKVTSAVLAAPLGAKGAVFVHALDGSVTALNAQNGQELWRYIAHSPSLMLRRSSSPILANNHIVVGCSNGKLVSLHRLDGMPNWEHELAIAKGRSDLQRMVDLSSDPVLGDAAVYAVSYQGQAAALKVNSGETLWDRSLSSYSGLALSNKAVFIPDSCGVLWALNRQSGKVLWKQEGLMGRQLSAPAVFYGFIVVGDEDGYLHWLLERDGSLVGRTMVDSKGIVATPIVKANTLYVLGRGGNVVAYHLCAQDIARGN